MGRCRGEGEGFWEKNFGVEKLSLLLFIFSVMNPIQHLVQSFSNPLKRHLVPKHNHVLASYFDEEENGMVVVVSTRKGWRFRLNSDDWESMKMTPFCCNGLGYAKASRMAKCQTTGGAVHRIVMVGVKGGVEGLSREGFRFGVDHINGDTSDNRRCNLRICDHHGNMRNQSKVSGASQFKGVYASSTKGKWRAGVRVTEEGRAINVYLGTFAVEEDAARAYDARVKELFGEFAKTNADLGLYEQA